MTEVNDVPMKSSTESEFESILEKIFDEEEDYKITQTVAVTHMNLKQLYMKVQKKTSLGSEQRIEDGIVHFTVTANVQIAKVRAFVERCSDWLGEMFLEHSEKGRSELHTKVVGQKMMEYYYVVDLDSVYCDDKGKKVYELDKNQGENRNNWLLFINIELIDQTTKEFLFGPFRLKTKPVKKPQAVKSPKKPNKPNRRQTEVTKENEEVRLERIGQDRTGRNWTTGPKQDITKEW